MRRKLMLMAAIVIMPMAYAQQKVQIVRPIDPYIEEIKTENEAALRALLSICELSYSEQYYELSSRKCDQVANNEGLSLKTREQARKMVKQAKEKLSRVK